MFDNLTYKNKTSLLILGVFVLGFILYKMTIQKTFDLINKKEQLTQQVQLANNAGNELISIREQLNSLESLIGKSNLKGNEIQRKLLNIVNIYCDNNNSSLKEVEKIHTYTTSDYEVVSNAFVVEGDFKSLLKLANQLERNFEEGRLASLTFNKEKNRITKRNKLYATYYIQNIRKNDEK